jgi:hypothetical protein
MASGLLGAGMVWLEVAMTLFFFLLGGCIGFALGAIYVAANADRFGPR